METLGHLGYLPDKLEEIEMWEGILMTTYQFSAKSYTYICIYITELTHVAKENQAMYLCLLGGGVAYFLMFKAYS